MTLSPGQDRYLAPPTPDRSMLLLLDERCAPGGAHPPVAFVSSIPVGGVIYSFSLSVLFDLELYDQAHGHVAGRSNTNPTVTWAYGHQ